MTGASRPALRENPHPAQTDVTLAGGSQRLAKLFENAGAEFGARYRPAEIEPLNLIGVGIVEKVDLCRRLDTLDGDPHVHLAAECDDRLDHRLDVRTGFFEALHEAAIDSDL